MSARVTDDSTIDEATAAQVTRNIELAFEFTSAIFADPSQADGMPMGATVVLIPDDDPDLAEANLATAITAFRSGRDVFLRHAGSRSING